MTLHILPERFSVGDLVAFRFPYTDGQEKTRICAIAASFTETGEAVVTYGTSNLRFRAEVAHALTVFRAEDCRAAGLHRPTRFQVDRRVRLRTDDPRFCTHREKATASVGRLPPEMTRRLAEIYASLPPVSLAAERQGVHPGCGAARQRGRFPRRPRPASQLCGPTC